MNDQHTTDVPMEKEQIPAAMSVGNADGEADVDMEETVDPRVAEFMARKTLSFPLAELSLEYPFMRDTFYVRECYAEYYDIIMKTFEDPEMLGVTVTGTPGIGKSVFMAYFYLRYKLEHANPTIVMVSFDVNSTLKKAVVLKDGQLKKMAASGVQSLTMVFQADPDAIFLIDGPPNTAPDMESHRYVVFTSPSEHWFRKMRKNPTHTRLLMPLWDEDELKDAVDKLSLDESLEALAVEAFPRRNGSRHSQEVVYRFDVFGGVARACLHHRFKFVIEQLLDLESAAADLSLTEAMAMKKSCEVKIMCHRLYHYVPYDKLSRWHLKVGSPYVRQLLTARLAEHVVDEQERFKAAIEQSPEAAALFGSIQEKDVLDELEGGTRIIARQLVQARGDPRANFVVEIQRTTPVVLLENKIEKSDLDRGLFFKPKGKTFESIDAFFLTKDQYIKPDAPWDSIEVILIQVTVSLRHPIKAKGLNTVLQQLGIDAKRAALVFAVPEDKAKRFKRQSIDTTYSLDVGSPITMVKGISKTIPAALEGTNIHTVGHLRKLPDNAHLQTVKQKAAYAAAQKKLQTHEAEEAATNSDAHRALDAVPQFVWGIGGAFVSGEMLVDGDASDEDLV